MREGNSIGRETEGRRKGGRGTVGRKWEEGEERKEQ